MYDEILDLVNEQDEVIGQKYRSEVWKENLKNFRTINGFILNDKKEIWIPRRSPEKKLFPLCLDSSVGGHVMSGESYDQAFERELHEETGIKLSMVSHNLVAKVTPFDYKVSSFSQIYVIHSNETPKYNKTDFIEYMWININELINKIKEGELTKSDLPVLTNILCNWLKG